MALQSINPTQTKSWAKLKIHFEAVKDTHMKTWFAENPGRADEFTINWEDFYVDFSKNRIDSETMLLFKELAEELQLKDAISKYFEGDIINHTEGRAVLHTALRAPKDANVLVDGENVIPEIHAAKALIKNFSEAIINGSKKGYTNKAFTDIVNIGIGGSDLGPAMVVDSLAFYGNHLTPHFVSNVDGDHVNEVIKNLNPETTLFVIVSKTFTTQETLSNANTIREWFLQHATQEDVAKHFVAVSTNTAKVQAFGIETSNIFPMWDWVGGRFSLWSAVGLSIALVVGPDNFEALLDANFSSPTHFRLQGWVRENIQGTDRCLRKSFCN